MQEGGTLFHLAKFERGGKEHEHGSGAEESHPRGGES